MTGEKSMDSQILIIGNGLDIDCNRPTRYTDFLNFLHLLDSLLSVKSFWDPEDLIKNVCIDECESDGLTIYVSKNYKTFRDDIKNDTCTCALTAIYKAVHPKSKKHGTENFWIEHFREEWNQRGNTWIDFESEMRKIIQMILDTQYYSDRFQQKKKIAGNENIIIDQLNPHLKYLKHIIEQAFGRKVLWRAKIIGNNRYFEAHNGTYDGLLWILENALQELSVSFEIYLSAIVSSIPPLLTEAQKQLFSEIKKAAAPLQVISFNYTHTIEEILTDFYDDTIPSPKFCHIHGEVYSPKRMEEILAKTFYRRPPSFAVKEVFDNTNIVLGIDGFSSDDNSMDYFQFCKSFQRVDRRADFTYRSWLTPEHLSKTKIYIFGHSLGMTDKEVLLPLVGKTKTEIYYPYRQNRKSIIYNLQQLLGNDQWQNYFQDEKITLVPQCHSKIGFENDRWYPWAPPRKCDKPENTQIKNKQIFCPTCSFGG